MAVLVACAVYDAAIKAFNRPFFVPTVGAAARSFSDEVNRDAPDNPMRMHPSDFSLWNIGSFDESSGRLTDLAVPEVISKASDVLVG